MGNNGTNFSKWKIILPTFLGFGAIVYLFLNDFLGPHKEENLASLKQVTVTTHTILWIFIAFLCIIGRDIGFMIRFRYSTDKLISWKQCLKITLLAEFGSAISPSSVGGSSMAILFLAKEGVPVGKSTTVVFVTTLLDEGFFVVVFPLLLLFIPVSKLFVQMSFLETGIISLFIIAYVIKLIVCVSLIIGLFFKPQAIHWLLITIFRLPFLKKWRGSVYNAGQDIIASSREIKGKGFDYWFPLCIATVLSWTSRYLVVNALFVAFFPVSIRDHVLIFTRQFVMWILMMVSPTPGGSGFTEIIFQGYLKEFIPIVGLIPVIILLWRLLSYYNYLFIGAILVPRWTRKVFKKE